MIIEVLDTFTGLVQLLLKGDVQSNAAPLCNHSYGRMCTQGE